MRHVSKKTFRFGRKRTTKMTAPPFHFRRRLKKGLVTPPPSCNYTAAASSVLADVYMNDSLGDCVIAGGYHVIGVSSANAGDMFIATSDQIIADYSAIGGYVPGDPSTDNGCELPDALSYWAGKGYADGSKLLGWLAVNPLDKAEMMAALYLFENLYIGMELPDAWVDPFPAGSGFTWDVAGDPVPSNGHCIMAAGYDATGLLVDTWGMMGHLTWAAVAKYCAPNTGGEIYVKVTEEMIARASVRAPNGFDWATLVSDFNDMGGLLLNLPPSPPPAPGPLPSPPVPPAPSVVTLAQAEAWAASKLRTLVAPISPGRAALLAKEGLRQAWPKQEKRKK